MAIKKIKISELPSREDLIGLWTIGVDKANKSCKVKLEFIKTSIDNAITAVNKVIDNVVKATNEAITKTEKATSDANKATEASIIQTETSKTQTARAKEHADNPQKMGDNGNWWKWDENLKNYVDTGILAKGGVLYPTFEINTDDMCVYMNYQNEIEADMFKMDENGCLIFNTK